MKPIAPALIDQTWEEVLDASPERSGALVEQMAREQPAILVYLQANEENWSTEDEPGTLLFLGLVVWQIMSRAGALPKTVTPEELEAAEDRNVRFLERVSEDAEANYLESVASMLGSYNQMPLLTAVLEALMEGNEETPELAGENLGMRLITLKTIIDCVDQSEAG